MEVILLFSLTKKKVTLNDPDLDLAFLADFETLGLSFAGYHIRHHWTAPVAQCSVAASNKEVHDVGKNKCPSRLRPYH